MKDDLEDCNLEEEEKKCKKKEKDCECCDDCNCGKDCNCNENDKCSENCTCDKKNKCKDNCECDDCKCGDKCECEDNYEKEGCHEHHHKHHKHEKKDEPDYLSLAQRIQAEFENYRRRMHDQLIIERQEGVISVIDVFLPCLDTFKEAKKSITDEKVLEGVNMIESKILDALKKLEVEKIDAVGQKFNPNFHDVIAVMHNENYDDDIILEEYQAGYKYKGKVIRYSKVIVNKKEGN